ncbi:uncharacterized protein LOC142338170 [Convolutriloba macropyga]|uniref:uncharacterized protein LOC142338170 n=1 Tax=Convolutriloba macropyga TaxID=536237 RepID=UPI003F5231FF
MSDTLNINNIENIADPATQRILFEISGELKEREAEIKELREKLTALEEKMEKSSVSEQRTLAVYGNTITELPHGINRAIAECVLPALLETFGMSNAQGQSAIGSLITQGQDGPKMGSQRHSVWATPDQMRKQFEDRDLNKLEKRAYKLFKKFDKDNNKKLDIQELRKYFEKQINEDDEEDIIEQALFL